MAQRWAWETERGAGIICHAKSWSCKDIAVPKLWTGDTKLLCFLESAGYQVTSHKHKEKRWVLFMLH